ncbi:MAG: hypothetical protein WD423_02225 [Rhodothermales bacterium]
METTRIVTEPIDAHASVVHRIAAEHHIPLDDAERRVEELIKFLYVAAESDAPVAPSKAVDAAWHAFILHTRNYAGFCEKVFGRFIHHEPADAGADTDTAYRTTLERLAARFGTPDPRYWPPADAAGCEEGQCTDECTGSCKGDG